MTKFIINNNDANQSIFKFIKKTYTDTPLSVIYKWFRKGDIRINDKRVKEQKTIIKLNDEVTVFDSNKPQVRSAFKYVTNVELDIVYQDDNILIVNKPFNLEIHSPINISLDDMVKSYLFDQKEYIPKTENSFVISHIHRLDKLTSGLVIYAKNKSTMDVLHNAIQNKDQIEKYYLIQTSNPINNNFIAKGYLRYNPEEQISVYRELAKNGYKECETHFNKIDKYLLEARLITGRKHQIRATLKYFDLSILNDFRYEGKKINNDKMIYLKAYKLIFRNFENHLSYLNDKIFELPMKF